MAELAATLFLTNKGRLLASCRYTGQTIPVKSGGTFLVNVK